MGKITRSAGLSDARTGEGMPVLKLRLPGEQAPEMIVPYVAGDYAPRDDYDDTEAWSYVDLQAECKRRGLSGAGDRTTLVERLRGNDHEEDEYDAAEDDEDV